MTVVGFIEHGSSPCLEIWWQKRKKTDSSRKKNHLDYFSFTAGMKAEKIMDVKNLKFLA